MATLVAAIDSRKAVEGVKQFDAAVGRFRDSSGKFVAGVNQGQGALNSLGNRLSGFSSIIPGFNRSIGTGASGLNSFIGSVGTATRTLVRFQLAFQITRSITESIRVIAEFEQTLVTLRAVTRASTLEFKALEETARRLGATTRFTAEESAQALLVLGRAGFTVKESIDSVAATLDLAQVAMISVEDAAKITASTVRQFGLNADQAQDAIDTLTIVANRTKVEVAQLAGSLKFAGTVARSANQDIDTTTAALGAMADAGIEASMAGTSLRGIIAALVSPTVKAQKALARMGLTAEEVNPLTHDLVEVFRTLHGAGFDAGEAFDIFTRRAAAGALVLADSTDKMDALVLATKRYRGEADRIARQQEQTLIGRFREFVSVLQEAALQAGDRGLLGALKNLLNGLTDLVRLATTSTTTIRNLSDEAVTLGTALATAFTPLPATLKLASFGLFAFRDALVEVNGATVTVGQVTKSVWIAVAENAELAKLRVQKVWETGRAVLITFFFQVRDAALDAWDAIVKGALEAEKLLPQGFGGRRNEIIEADIAQVVGAGIRRRQETQKSIEQLATGLQLLDDQIAALERRTGGEIATFYGEIQKSADETRIQVEALTLTLKAGQAAVLGFFTGQHNVGRDQARVFVDTVKEAKREVEEIPDKISQVRLDEINAQAMTFSEILGNGLEDAILHFESLRDVGKAVFQELIRAALQFQVIAPFKSFLFGSFGGTPTTGGGESALGNVLSGRRIVPYQQGGVVNSPLLFPLNNGKTGVAGEAGPEAILPLKRGPSGRLGVEAAATERPVNLTLNINGIRDARGMDRSARQLATRVRRELQP